MLSKAVCYTSWLYLVLAGIKVQKKIISADEINYSYYLGPDYRKEKSNLGERGRVSKIIAPHVSLFDIQTLITVFDGDVSFVAGDFI